jgi:hypothetical protein
MRKEPSRMQPQNEERDGSSLDFTSHQPLDQDCEAPDAVWHQSFTFWTSYLSRHAQRPLFRPQIITFEMPWAGARAVPSFLRIKVHRPASQHTNHEPRHLRQPISQQQRPTIDGEIHLGISFEGTFDDDHDQVGRCPNSGEIIEIMME